LAKLWNCPFFESSAKEGVNVEPAFTALVREVLAERERSGKQRKEKKKKCILV